MDSYMLSGLTWLIAVLALLGGFALTVFKPAHSAHSREQVKAVEHDRGTRICDEPVLEPRHKIFLSHSGVQKDFVDQLCQDLESFHHFPFFDKRNDSLPKGEKFPDLIFQAARQCRVAIVVLSEDFFTRTKWPMLELDAFVKAQKLRHGNPRILPLFFKLTRAQCRDGRRREQWLKVWRRWAQDDSSIVIEDWVEALKVFGSTTGIEYKSEGEVSYRKDARAAIIGLVPPDLKFDTSFLQGSDRFCEVILEKFHQNEASMKYGVRVVGLYGVGGIGKTTVCKALCNRQSAEYDGNVCLAELGTVGIVELQKQVLRELIHVNPELLEGVSRDKGGHLLKERMHRQKVFLAIDNVWDNLDSRGEALTFLQAGFQCDSTVLVTARTIDILLRLHIDPLHCIEMPELEKEEATNLFLHHAISHCPQLESDQRDVVERCVQRCWFSKGGSGTTAFHYLPLAIKVLAGHLGASSDDPLDWGERLSSLNFNSFQDEVHPIFSILRTGSDSLSEAQQLLFMDVNLFFPRPDSDLDHFFQGVAFSRNIFHWLSMLHNRSLDFIMDNLRILKRRSLLEDLGDGFTRITLHDLYYEFAILESQAKDFSKRRWLFADYDAIANITSEVAHSTNDVPMELQRHPGLSSWPALRRIAICNSQLQSLERSDLQYCSNVELLKLVKCYRLDKVDVHVLACLKFLEVDGCSNLKEGMHGIEHLKKLIWLRWSHIDRDPGFSDFSPLKSLRVMELEGDSTLTGSELSSLPGLEACTNLVELTLMNHNELLAFPDLSNMVFLQKVRFELCRKARGLKGLSSKMTQLQVLVLGSCPGIVELPGVEDLSNLQKLQLVGCRMLVLFPNLKKLNKLLSLDISNSSFTECASISELVHLQELQCICCFELTGLPDLSKLRNLQVFSLVWCGRLKSLHESSIGHLTALRKLECKRLEELSEVPDLSNLRQIQVISFRGCIRLTSVLEANIDRLTTLQSLDVSYTRVSTLPDLSNMKDLEVCEFSHSLVRVLPEGFARLATFHRLEMNQCLFFRVPLLRVLAEGVPKAQQLAAMIALKSNYDKDIACTNEVHPVSSDVIRLLKCLLCSGNWSSLRKRAARLLSVMSFQFGSTANSGFNTNVLEILGQVDGGVENVIKVFCEHEDASDLFYVIAGLVFIGHHCSALRASSTLHQISRKVIRFAEEFFVISDSRYLFSKPWLSLLHVLGIITVDPVIARAFGDHRTLDFLERIKLRYVNHDFSRLDRDSACYARKSVRKFCSAVEVNDLSLARGDVEVVKFEDVNEYEDWTNQASSGHRWKQRFLARIEAVENNARLASLSSH